jgi:sulfatase modifying factor 1
MRTYQIGMIEKYNCPDFCRKVFAAIFHLIIVLGLLIGASGPAQAKTLCKSYSGLPHKFPVRQAGMKLVPAGHFLMGSDKDYPEELPMRKVSVASFWMDRHEVTNAEFAAFVAATSYLTTAEKPLPPDIYPGLADEYRLPGSMVFVIPEAPMQQYIPSMWWKFTAGANWRHPAGPGSSISGRDAEPVTQVSWQDAMAYAKWRGHDLPTEAEWEWAARGGTKTASTAAPPDANIWEGVFPYFDAANDGYHGTAPVGCFKPNHYGLYDMIGNVWEWTTDIYQSDQMDIMPAQLPPGLPEQRVIKGGSWLCSPSFCGRYRPSARQPGETDLGSNHIGFRTVLRPASSGGPLRRQSK